MAIQHCDDVIGVFDYDDTEFELNIVPFDGIIPGRTILHYIGKETDGSKIKIPEGITSIARMFVGSNLKTPPLIPNSVTNMYGAFARCESLEEAPVIPHGVEDLCKTFFSDRK